MPISIDIEGPALSQISFAHVVRSIAFALDDLGCDVSVQPTDRNSGGYKKVATERNFDRLSTMISKRPSGFVKILYNFPVYMASRCKGYNFAIVSWETTSAPSEWIRELNATADQVWSISSFVNESFLAGGLQPSKARVIPMGVDPSVFSPYAPPLQLETKKRFRFLHLGVAQHRKGTPLLLKAYTRAFTNKDDVCLIIKSNGFGIIDDLINEYKKPNGPEILYIYEETKEELMSGYYTASDCFVYPVNAEGAGLPVLESLACGRPVIVPMWSGISDFCDSNNAFVIKHKIVPLKSPYSSYSGTGVETWADPSEDDLVEQMRFAVSNPEIVSKKGQYAASYVNKTFTWHNTAVTVLKNINEFVKSEDVEETIRTNPSPKTKTAIKNRDINVEITNVYNGNKIGILSSYCPYLESYHYAKASLNSALTNITAIVSKLAGDSRLIRCLDPGVASPNTIISICHQNKINVLQIHWDRSILPSHAFPHLLRSIRLAGIRSIVFLHDELPQDIPADFFYLADYFVTNSVKYRNYLTEKQCPISKLRYVKPTKFDMPFYNRQKIRSRMSVGTGNFVFISPVYIDETSSCIHVINEIKEKIIDMPHVKYIIAVLSGEEKLINKHISAIKNFEHTATIIRNVTEESFYYELLSIADAFILPYRSQIKPAKNPVLIPLLSVGVPIVADPDCVTSELDDVILLGSQNLSDISKCHSKPKNILSDVKEYIKTMESIYYHIAHSIIPCQSFETHTSEIIPESIFDSEQEIVLSEL